MASSRRLLDSRDGVNLWRVELGGGLNQTFFVECPHFEHSLAFAAQAEAQDYMRAYSGGPRGALAARRTARDHEGT
jgi:hypothetical protein